jgi:transcriptional regulator with XRE-family HTH domain
VISPSTFDEWFQDKLRLCGHTEASIAVALGISQQAVSRWRTGTARPRGHRLIQLAGLLGVTHDEVVANLGTEPGVWARHDLAIEELRRRVTRLEAAVATLNSK